MKYYNKNWGTFNDYKPSGYVHEKNFKNGKWHGLYAIYNENGRKVTEVQYSDGETHGYRKKYEPSGKVKSTETFIHGVKVE